MRVRASRRCERAQVTGTPAESRRLSSLTNGSYAAAAGRGGASRGSRRIAAAVASHIAVRAAVSVGVAIPRRTTVAATAAGAAAASAGSRIANASRQSQYRRRQRSYKTNAFLPLPLVDIAVLLICHMASNLQQLEKNASSICHARISSSVHDCSEYPASICVAVLIFLRKRYELGIR